MENPYDSVCEIDNFWKTHLKNNSDIDPMLASLFKEGIYEIKANCQKNNYLAALPTVRTIIESFNPEHYKNKPHELHAKNVLRKLKYLESVLERG